MSSWRGVASRAARVASSPSPDSLTVADVAASRAADAHGRSKFRGRAESMMKSASRPEPFRRNTSAPRCRQSARPITVARQSSGGSPRLATTSTARAQSSSYASAVDELADATGWIAGDPLSEAWIVHIAAVAVGGEPFAHRETVAAVMHRKPAVGAANRETAAIAGNQHVSPRRRCRPEYSEHDRHGAGPP